MLRTLCNGWITGRRMQGAAPCVLGCTGGADSLEHYARCPAFAEFRGSRLGLVPSGRSERMDEFLGLHDRFGRESEGLLVKGACSVYALYTVHNWARHSPLPPVLAREGLAQRLREAVRGHARACALVFEAGGH